MYNRSVPNQSDPIDPIPFDSVEPAMEATVAERGQITLPKSVRDALGLTKGTKLTVELDGSRIVLRKDVGAALARLRGLIKLPPGVSTDDVMRELRGRAPGDPYPPPTEEE
jgi:AbrB family looped-hinge helix DNA binding protein